MVSSELRTYIKFAHSAFSWCSLPMSNTLTNVAVRALEPGELFEDQYLGDAGMANGYDEPVNWARIAVSNRCCAAGFWRLVLCASELFIVWMKAGVANASRDEQHSNIHEHDTEALSLSA
jgi:hypothetical protein